MSPVAPETHNFKSCVIFWYINYLIASKIHIFYPQSMTATAHAHKPIYTQEISEKTTFYFNSIVLF